MTREKISEYDASAGSNTDVNGVNIAEGCAPSGINNAIREVMAALKRFETGADGDSLTVGGNLVVSGTVSFANDVPVASGGTGASTAADARTNLGAQALLVSGTNIKTINSTSLLGSGDIAIVGAVPYGLFRKADPTIVAWSKTGNFTATTATTLYIEVNGTLHTIASGTSITMPGSATTGTDYAIWCKTDGTLEATTNHTSPPSANARKVGGFHYAPGGNATGTSGGNTTAQINAYSMWDLKWRPACPDPRGMTLVAGGFWADIYLCGVDHYTNGTSKYNVTIADGSSLPKISAAFGGNGSTTYAGGTWFAFNEIMAGVGKKLPTYLEFCALAYGTTEAASFGSDPTSTILREAYTSKWGVMLATGNMWQWSRDFIASGDGTGNWQTGLTETRGNIYTFNASARAGILGGGWNDGSNSGSRCSVWLNDPSLSFNTIGGRGVCDHLQLD